MIDIKQQEEIFIAIGNILEKKIVAYAIGGTAMMLKSIKDSTLDVDFVFDKENDRTKIILALKKLGAKESDATLTYGLNKNIPLMVEINNARFDLFLNKIVTSVFSEKMKNRANEIHEFGENLIVKAADIHDIILMKSSTSRIKDIDDITLIIEKNPINWDIIIDEAENQVNLGHETAIISLGEKLEKLNNQKRVIIPQEVLDKLWHILKN